MQYCNFLWNPTRDIVCSNISNTFSLIKSYDSLCLCNSCDELNSFFMNKTIKNMFLCCKTQTKTVFRLYCMNACIQEADAVDAAHNAQKESQRPCRRPHCMPAQLPAQCKEFICTHIHKSDMYNVLLIKYTQKLIFYRIPSQPNG